MMGIFSKGETMVFIAKNKVRMNDTDMAGILYFGNQFRYVHDALEDLFESEGLPFEALVHREPFLFVIVHCAADFLRPLGVGDALEVHLKVAKIGNSSFTMRYSIHGNNGACVGTAETVHCVLDKESRKKAPIPPKLRVILEKHLEE